MRPVHFILTAFMTVSFSAMLGAAVNAATVTDWIIPGLFGVCTASSLGLTLFAPTRRRCSKESSQSVE